MKLASDKFIDMSASNISMNPQSLTHDASLQSTSDRHCLVAGLQTKSLVFGIWNTEPNMGFSLEKN